MINQQQIQNKSIVSIIKNKATRNQEAEKLNFSVGACSPIQTYSTMYYVSPNYEGHKKTMTDREAESVSETDSD